MIDFKLYPGDPVFAWIVGWYSDKYKYKSKPGTKRIHVVDGLTSPRRLGFQAITVGKGWLNLIAKGDPELMRLLVLEEL